MKKMPVLIELLQKKHFGESKRDNLYNQIMGDGYANIPLFILIATDLFCADFRRKYQNSSGKVDCLGGTLIVVLVISMISGLFIFCRNLSNCYYKLPRYRRKICEIDYQIIEELKKISI